MPKSPQRRHRRRLSKRKCFSGVLEAHRPVLLHILTRIIPQFDELSEVLKEWVMDTCEKIKLSTHCDPPSGEETDMEERDRCYIETFVDKCEEELNRLEDIDQHESDFYNELVDLETYFVDRKNRYYDEDEDEPDTERLERLYTRFIGPIGFMKRVFGFDIGTLNEIVLHMIPNNEREDRMSDFEFLYRMGATLTEIPTRRFKNKELTHVTIPHGIKEINVEAFTENQLTEVTIPDSVTTIGSYAFKKNRLTQVMIPDSVTTIESEAFYQNQLTQVSIGNSVTTIGHAAFTYNQLTQVTIPESVRTIGSFAFSENRLTQLTIPESVRTIDRHAFDNNPLQRVLHPNPNLRIEFRAFGDYSDPRLLHQITLNNLVEEDRIKENGRRWKKMEEDKKIRWKKLEEENMKERRRRIKSESSQP
jgi:hypothetical protein